MVELGPQIDASLEKQIELYERNIRDLFDVDYLEIEFMGFSDERISSTIARKAVNKSRKEVDVSYRGEDFTMFLNYPRVVYNDSSPLAAISDGEREVEVYPGYEIREIEEELEEKWAPDLDVIEYLL